MQIVPVVRGDGVYQRGDGLPFVNVRPGGMGARLPRRYAHTHMHAHTHTRTHARTNTHTHAHTHLYLYYHCQNWLCGPNSGGESAEGNKTGGPVGSRDTSLIFPVAWPPQCSRGTHLWACKTHEMREVGYSLE